MKKILVIGSRRNDREALIHKVMQETRLPSNAFIDVGLDVNKMKGLRDMPYVDSGLRDDKDVEKYYQIGIELKIGEHYKFGEQQPHQNPKQVQNE